MKAFVCVILFAAAALAAPAPEGQRDKRSYLDSGFFHSSPIYTHSISEPIIAHSSHIVSEPAIISVKKIVEVPKVVAVKKIVTVPHVVSYPRISSISYAPRLSSYSYAPTYSSYSSGWW